MRIIDKLRRAYPGDWVFDATGKRWVDRVTGKTVRRVVSTRLQQTDYRWESGHVALDHREYVPFHVFYGVGAADIRRAMESAG